MLALAEIATVVVAEKFAIPLFETTDSTIAAAVGETSTAVPDGASKSDLPAGKTGCETTSNHWLHFDRNLLGSAKETQNLLEKQDQRNL